jgi:sugar diacid utilization regulator
VDQDLQRLAGRFLEFMQHSTGLPLIVCDETGTIIKCKDRTRLGVVHAFAKRIMSGEADELFVTAEDVERDGRMKEGCNCVIEVDGKRLGTFGIAGRLEIVRPLARIATAVIASWLQDVRRQSALTGAADSVFSGMRQVSSRTAEVSIEANRVTENMTQASSDASSKLAKSGEIIRTVQEIAQKSRMLSINGSVEASRAGEHGRAFGVVAREMLVLAEDARGAANNIQATLGEVQTAIAELEAAIRRSATLAATQNAAFAEIKSVVDFLQHVVSGLAGTRT